MKQIESFVSPSCYSKPDKRSTEQDLSRYLILGSVPGKWLEAVYMPFKVRVKALLVPSQILWRLVA